MCLFVFIKIETVYGKKREFLQIFYHFGNYISAKKHVLVISHLWNIRIFRAISLFSGQNPKGNNISKSFSGDIIVTFESSLKTFLYKLEIFYVQVPHFATFWSIIDIMIYHYYSFNVKYLELVIISIVYSLQHG